MSSNLESLLNVKEKHKLRTQAQERYSATRLQEPEELMHYNNTFSTLGHHEEMNADASGAKETRIKPARLNSSNGPRDVYERLYQPQRKEKVRKNILN